MLFDTNKITTQALADDFFTDHGIELHVLRLDLIHGVVSGNKLFKLQHFLEKALASPEKTIVSFGGAYSNHLVATAYACQHLGLKSVGLVRGEKPAVLSHSLQHCIQLNMQLIFLSREQYQQQAMLGIAEYQGTVVPEGGYHPLGAKGASAIMNLFPLLNPTHVVTATGTATTLTGLLLNTNASQTIISVPVIKGMDDLNERIKYLSENKTLPAYESWPDAHEGGYAKHSPGLIGFMNSFYRSYQLPTDVVYTGKMMKAVMQKIESHYFPRGSQILCIHTGGLQGNRSFPENTFLF